MPRALTRDRYGAQHEKDLERRVQRLERSSGNGPVVVQQLISIWAGNGAPSSSFGNNGDLYVNDNGGSGTTIYQMRGGAWVGIV